MVNHTGSILSSYTPDMKNTMRAGQVLTVCVCVCVVSRHFKGQCVNTGAGLTGFLQTPLSYELLSQHTSPTLTEPNNFPQFHGLRTPFVRLSLLSLLLSALSVCVLCVCAWGQVCACACIYMFVEGLFCPSGQFEMENNQHSTNTTFMLLNGLKAVCGLVFWEW